MQQLPITAGTFVFSTRVCYFKWLKSRRWLSILWKYTYELYNCLMSCVMAYCNMYIVHIIMVVTSITDARRPLIGLPGSDAVKLADASVVADELEAVSGTSQSTFSVYRNLVSSALVRRRIQLLVARQTAAVNRWMQAHRSSTLIKPVHLNGHNKQGSGTKLKHKTDRMIRMINPNIHISCQLLCYDGVDWENQRDGIGGVWLLQ